MLSKWDTFHFEGEKSLFPAESHSKRFISSQRLVAEFLQRSLMQNISDCGNLLTTKKSQPLANISLTLQLFMTGALAINITPSSSNHLQSFGEYKFFSYTSGCQVDTNQSVGLCNSDLSNIWIFFPELKQIYITTSSSFLDLNIFLYLCVYFYTWTLDSVPETLAIVRNSVKLRAIVYVWEQHQMSKINKREISKTKLMWINQ